MDDWRLSVYHCRFFLLRLWQYLFFLVMETYSDFFLLFQCKNVSLFLSQCHHSGCFQTSSPITEHWERISCLSHLGLYTESHAPVNEYGFRTDSRLVWFGLDRLSMSIAIEQLCEIFLPAGTNLGVRFLFLSHEIDRSWFLGTSSALFVGFIYWFVC